MKIFMSASVLVLSLVAFDNSASAGNAFLDIAEKVNDFIHGRTKTSPKVNVHDNTTTPAHQVRNSITFEGFDTLVGTISSRKHAAPDIQESASSSIITSLKGMARLERLAQDLENIGLASSSHLPKQLTFPSSSYGSVNDPKGERRHHVSLASQDAMNELANVSMGSQHPLNTPLEGKETLARVHKAENLWDRLPDVLILNLACPETVRYRLWMNRLYQRGKANEHAKHPYLGFVNVKDENGNAANDMMKGYKTLFRLEDK